DGGRGPVGGGRDRRHVDDHGHEGRAGRHGDGRGDRRPRPRGVGDGESGDAERGGGPDGAAHGDAVGCQWHPVDWAEHQLDDEQRGGGEGERQRARERRSGGQGDEHGGGGRGERHGGGRGD